MAEKRKAVPSQTQAIAAQQQRGATTDPYISWDYNIRTSRKPVLKKMWSLYTTLFNGQAQYAIVPADWTHYTRTKKTMGKVVASAWKYYVDMSKPSYPAQPWYPNYKYAAEFTTTYESLRSCLDEARQNYMLYAIFRVVSSEITFVLSRQPTDIRMFRYQHRVWRLVGGTPKDIPFKHIPIDPDRVCKYFQLWLYTSPGYL